MAGRLSKNELSWERMRIVIRVRSEDVLGLDQGPQIRHDERPDTYLARRGVKSWDELRHQIAQSFLEKEVVSIVARTLRKSFPSTGFMVALKKKGREKRRLKTLEPT